MEDVYIQEEIILKWVYRMWNGVIEWIDLAHSINMKAAISFIMLVSTSVYTVTTHNSVLQYHRVQRLPTFSAISSSAQRQSTNNSTLNSRHIGPTDYN
jgi:hypothetical protein